MVRDEWPGDGASGNGLHHGSFYFDKSVRIHETPHRLHQFAALEKHFANLGIHNQVYVALAVAQFDICQSVPFFGQRQQILG